MPLEVEVQVIAFSDDVAIVSLPGEIFVELGLAIKKASPFKHTFIAELANGSIGYVPNREAYPQGNYEVVSARGEAGSGEMLVETALKLLEEVHAAPGRPLKNKLAARPKRQVTRILPALAVEGFDTPRSPGRRTASPANTSSAARGFPRPAATGWSAASCFEFGHRGVAHGGVARAVFERRAPSRGRGAPARRSRGCAARRSRGSL